MSDCNHDCGSCSAKLRQQNTGTDKLLEPLYRESSVKKVIGIVSGKEALGNP